MKKLIAIPVNEQGILDAHFGHCKFFAMVSVENGSIKSVENILPPPHEPGLLPKWLSDKGTTDIIAGGMGNKAIQLFKQYKINAFTGAPQKEAPALAEDFLQDKIAFSANYCDH